MLTEISQLREHLTTPTTMNLMVPTEMLIDHDASPSRLQLEGFVLHPRRLECVPFEVSTDDGQEIVYRPTGSRAPRRTRGRSATDSLSASNAVSAGVTGDFEERLARVSR